MEWVSILRCPVTKSELVLLEPGETDDLNARIQAGRLLHLSGEPVTDPVTQGLKTRDNGHVYPIIDGIVVLLKELAIAWEAEAAAPELLNADKHQVKNFYDLKGWFTDEEGNYEDAIIYEDLRAVSADYIRKCHERVGRYIHPSGKYLLDAASGPVQYPEYLAYSANYQYRICADFSLQALREAKKKLGPKGIYVLCDITHLPFRKNSVDSFVSLHTIYHVPKDQQAKAIRELYRVLMPQGKGIVVYDWFKHSPWMNYWLLPSRALLFTRNRVMRTLGKIKPGQTPVGRLYFYSHKLEYLRKNLPPFRLAVWRSLSVPFLRTYIHPWLFGRQVLEKVYAKEEQAPERCGRKGEYPLFIFEKPADG